LVDWKIERETEKCIDNKREVWIGMVWDVLMANEIIVSVAIAFMVCQLIKIITASFDHGRLSLAVFFETGGMPSTHSAFVASLALSVGLVEGFLSSVFLVALAFALIIIRDAVGVRRTVDDLIASVNAIIKQRQLRINHIRVIAGHTPVQVFVGIVVSVTTVLLVHHYLF
jgi:acid phosphatase family membrane protein YuiD